MKKASESYVQKERFICDRLGPVGLLASGPNPSGDYRSVFRGPLINAETQV